MLENEIKNWLESCVQLFDYDREITWEWDNDFELELTIDNHGISIVKKPLIQKLTVYINPDKFKGEKLPYKFNLIDGSFNCSSLGLTTLENSPNECETISCASNKLTSLKYCPKAQHIIAENNELNNIKGAPLSVCSLNLNYNKNLQCLEYGPMRCQYLYIKNCDLKSLFEVPQGLYEIYLSGNKNIKNLNDLDIRNLNVFEVDSYLFDDNTYKKWLSNKR